MMVMVMVPERFQYLSQVMWSQHRGGVIQYTRGADFTCILNKSEWDLFQLHAQITGDGRHYNLLSIALCADGLMAACWLSWLYYHHNYYRHHHHHHLVIKVSCKATPSTQKSRDGFRCFSKSRKPWKKKRKSRKQAKKLPHFCFWKTRLLFKSILGILDPFSSIEAIPHVSPMFRNIRFCNSIDAMAHVLPFGMCGSPSTPILSHTFFRGRALWGIPAE